jgi:hypothetical protein
MPSPDIGNGIGRIRMQRVDDVSGKSLLSFVREVTEPKAVIHSDGWPGYSRLTNVGYAHEVTVVSRREEMASELLPRVHRVASLLKRWLLGTHQGAVGGNDLDYLPRPIYVSIQSPNVKTPWQTVLPSHSASGPGRSRHRKNIAQQNSTNLISLFTNCCSHVGLAGEEFSLAGRRCRGHKSA